MSAFGGKADNGQPSLMHLDGDIRRNPARLIPREQLGRCSPGPLRARPRPAGLSEVRVPLIARRHDLRVDLRQCLGGLLSLWRTCDNGLDAIHHDPSTNLGSVGNKTRLCARGCDPGAGVPGNRFSGRRLSGLCQQGGNEKAN